MGLYVPIYKSRAHVQVIVSVECVSGVFNSVNFAFAVVIKFGKVSRM